MFDKLSLYIKFRSLLPWLIILVLCVVTFTLVSLFFDIETLAQMWWTIPVGGMIAAISVNICQLKGCI